MSTYRAGDTVEELCRVCKIDRLHTVIATDAGGRPVRVQCDYCGSQHNSRGGGASAGIRRPPALDSHRAESRWQAIAPRLARPSNAPAFLTAKDLDPALDSPPLQPHNAEARAGGDGWLDGDVAGGEAPDAQQPPMTPGRMAEGDDAMADLAALEIMFRRILREEGGIAPVEPAEKWRGGLLVLKPANPSLQEKSWPIDTLFHKIVMIRNRLRTLEQQVNAMDLPEDEKIRLQAYITGCYGSLTSFNILFADDDDHFRGTGE